MTNAQNLIANIGNYYNQSLEVLNEFGGPSIYFHVQCIKEQHTSFLSSRHIELIYATLTSWGMHRMGNPQTTKTKLHEFKEFKASIICSKDVLQELAEIEYTDIDENDYLALIQGLKGVYSKLMVSISNATIVGHSKTLAHILPNLIPPIDRQYTIRFFTRDKSEFLNKNGKYRLVQVPNGLDAQFDLFAEICQKMKKLFEQADRKMFTLDPDTFNTSYPKIMDNLIMAFVKSVQKPKT